MNSYDVIVLGAGGVGSAALFELAKRGVRALGIDRFHPPHDRGSTHGHTRVIRQAYFEHPDYVPLLLEAYRLWRQLEDASGQSLLHEVGLVEVGPAHGVVVPGVLRAAADHGLDVEKLSAAEVESRWPRLRVPANLAAVFEPRAGYLLVEDCVRAQLAAAEKLGAEFCFDTEVIDWSADERGVRVQTATEEFAAKKLIIAAGPWASSLLANLGPPLEVRRKSLFWFATKSTTYDVAGGFPVFLFELPDGVFYGFPKLDARGLKVAEHSGGTKVDDPSRVDRDVDPEEERRVRDFLVNHLPEATPRVVDHTTCLYTMTPDEHFIVDRLPGHENVVLAAGLSGHGFKFTPVLGKALAELAMDGGTTLPIDFLSLARFGGN